MASLAFEKIHSGGNDFLLLNAEPDPNLIATLCHRQRGIGADGVFWWACEANEAHLHHCDPDGSRTFCLNGTRSALACLAQQQKINSEGWVQTEGHRFRYLVTGPTVETEMPLRPYQPLLWSHGDWQESGFYCNVGNPHMIFFSSLSDAVFREMAPLVRHDLARFPEGTNVHRVWCEQDQLRICSYERGVEGFTLACGTGMYATALVNLGETGSDQVTLMPDGGEPVTFQRRGETLWMKGTTHWVATGVFRC